MAIDPTDLLFARMALKKVVDPVNLPVVAQQKPPIQGDLPLPLARTAFTAEEQRLMSQYERQLFNLLQGRLQWRFKNMGEVRRALDLGKTVWPHYYWEFYTLDRIKELPQRPLFVVTARRHYYPERASFTLCPP